jgi:hypothetical protein
VEKETVRPKGASRRWDLLLKKLLEKLRVAMRLGLQVVSLTAARGARL